MKLRKLGKSDLEVSEVGFGAWTLATGWWGEAQDATTMLNAALDCGINFIDTAPAYGDGFGETVIAPFIAEHKDELIITTKCGYDITAERPDDGRHKERPHDWKSDSIIKQVEDSLARLGLETIDLLQLHNIRLDGVTNDELFATLDDLIAQGKVRYLGVALGPAIGWVEEGIVSLDKRNIVSLQTVYNILEQEPGNTFALHENCQNNNVSLISRVPHASDALTRRVTRETLQAMLDSGDHRSYRVKENMLDNLDKVDAISFLWAKETGRTISQAAIAGILAKKEFGCVLPTCTSVEQIHEYAKAGDTPLTDDESQLLWELYDVNFNHENRFEMELRS